MIIAKQLSELIESANRLRTRLVWLVGMPGTGKTTDLKAVATSHPSCVYVNLNAGLSSRLATDAPDQQPFRVGQHLNAILSQRPQGAWLVDNVEILFSRHLKIPVVDRLNSLAQQATLVIAWPGTIESGKLVYGDRTHPDFAEFPQNSPLVLDLNNTNDQGQ